MEEVCLHKNKAYSNYGTTLTCYPPIHISYWICKDCGYEGQDSHKGAPEMEYEETKKKFGKKANKVI
jgi:hypothetical protein